MRNWRKNGKLPRNNHTANLLPIVFFDKVPKNITMEQGLYQRVIYQSQTLHNSKHQVPNAFFVECSCSSYLTSSCIVAQNPRTQGGHSIIIHMLKTDSNFSYSIQHPSSLKNKLIMHSADIWNNFFNNFANNLIHSFFPNVTFWQKLTRDLISQKPLDVSNFILLFMIPSRCLRLAVPRTAKLKQRSTA